MQIHRVARYIYVHDVEHIDPNRALIDAHVNVVGMYRQP